MLKNKRNWRNLAAYYAQGHRNVFIELEADSMEWKFGPTISPFSRHNSKKSSFEEQYF